MARKNWAKTFNVTHYTHWFQPLTDGTAEKHDGLLEFGDDGNVIERFGQTVYPTGTGCVQFSQRRYPEHI